MWINEIINVVVENKNEKTFYAKSVWGHDDMNIIIQFVERYTWGAIELTSEQYELIDKVSYDADTYDTQYNTNSRYDIKEFEEILFVDDRNFIEVEFCTMRRTAEKHPIPDNDTLEGMSNLSWFQEKYGTDKSDSSALYEVLPKNGWTFLGHSYSINGEITVMNKRDYDYLWISDDHPIETGEIVEKDSYGVRISFLNNLDED